MFSLFSPRHTFKEVLQRLEVGLANGDIVLSQGLTPTPSGNGRVDAGLMLRLERIRNVVEQLNRLTNDSGEAEIQETLNSLNVLLDFVHDFTPERTKEAALLVAKIRRAYSANLVNEQDTKPSVSREIAKFLQEIIKQKGRALNDLGVSSRI